MSWLDAVRDIPATDVAERLGYEIKRGPSASHTKCPACGTERRHRKTRDKRGSVGLPHSGGWRCWTCDASGDAIDFVAYDLGGERFRDASDALKSEVRAWFEGKVASELPRASRLLPALRKHEQHPAWENADAAYPPIGQVEALWDACLAVDQDAEVLAYLAHRDIKTANIVEHDCARALPVGVLCPTWARINERPWTETRHRLLVPMYDQLGQMRSLLARSVEMSPAIKSVGASGYARRGLVMAGQHGRQVLLSGPVRSLHRIENYQLKIYEGEIDWLRAVGNGEDCEVEYRMHLSGFRGAMGIVSGSFTRDIACRIPAHSTVVLCTDDDEAGDKYAADIAELLGTKITVERFRPAKD
jgi:hypothetical protein